MNHSGLKNYKIWALALIFLLALILRLLVVFQSSKVLSGDELAYDAYANSIIRGRGFAYEGKPTSYRPPLYSLFLSFIYFVFGTNYLLIKSIQALMGTITCIVIYLLARKLISETVAWIACIISVLYPPFIWVSSRLLTESLFLLLVLTSIFYLVRHKLPTSKDFCLGGLFLGLATLTKGTTQLFPLCVFLYLLRYVKKRMITLKVAGKLSVVFIFFFSFPILPWTIRNYVIHGTFVPVTTEAGAVFYASYFPKDGKIYGITPQDSTFEEWKKIKSETEGSAFLIKKTFEYITNNPRQIFLHLLPLKAAYFFSPFDWEILSGAYNFVYVFLLPFFIGGIIYLSRIKNNVLPIKLLYLLMLYCFLLALVFYGSARYRLIIEPYLIIFAAFGIFLFFKRFHYKAIPALATVVFFIINLTVFFYAQVIKDGIKAVFHFVGIW